MLEERINNLEKLVTFAKNEINEFAYISGRVDGDIAIEQIARSNIKLISFDKKVECHPEKEDTPIEYKGIKLTKRKDDRWQAKLPLQDGRYKHIYGKTQKICYNKLKEEYSITYTKEKPKRVTLFNDWLKTWLKVYKQNTIKETTLRQNSLLIKKYIENSLGKLKLNQINKITIQETLNSITATRQKQKIYDILKDSLTRAYENKLLKEDIFIGLQKPKHVKKESKAFTKKQQMNFVEEVKNSKYENFYLMLLYQGLRSGELLALLSKDINLEKKTITINKAMNTLGKVTTPKTKDSVRTIPIFRNTISICEELKKNSGILFNITRTPLQEEFRAIMNKLNLKGFTMHSLRHTFITRLAEQGISSKLIQKWVGHSTNLITEKVYTHINEDYELKIAQEINTNFDTDLDTRN